MKIFIFSAIVLLCMASCGNNTNQCENTQKSTEYMFLENKQQTFDDFSIYWLKDNQGDRKFQFDLFGSVDDSVKNIINMPDGMPSSISAYIIKTANKILLFDSGLGVNAGGQLLNELSKIGIKPEQVDYVYITHFHGDHIGGMLTPEGEKTFANAQVYVSQLEIDSELGKTTLALAMSDKYDENIHVFNFGDTLPEGVLALDAVGHTPGHTVFRKGNLLIIGDLMHALALQLPYPEYCANFDGDKAKAIESRKRILNYALQNNLTMCGMHLPY